MRSQGKYAAAVVFSVNLGIFYYTERGSPRSERIEAGQSGNSFMAQYAIAMRKIFDAWEQRK